ncbi:MAG: class I SAM-dependent methyltransferase, partial [Actinobacteria bacterium]|nr:class I SAM-dependent methyltransferase [Actinomycetota bacterium]
FAAAAALGEEGRLISTDFAPNMMQAARAESQRLGLGNVGHRQLDAERLDLDNESVDGVLCRWGYMLMADPAAALRETRRVLRDGGALALSVWGCPEGNPWASIPGRALLEHTGASPPDPTAPGIFAMADPERTRSLLAAAGFEVQRWENLELSWRFQDFDAYWRFLTQLAGGNRALNRHFAGRGAACITSPGRGSRRPLPLKWRLRDARTCAEHPGRLSTCAWRDKRQGQTSDNICPVRRWHRLTTSWPAMESRAGRLGESAGCGSDVR